MEIETDVDKAIRLYREAIAIELMLDLFGSKSYTKAEIIRALDRAEDRVEEVLEKENLKRWKQENKIK